MIRDVVWSFSVTLHFAKVNLVVNVRSLYPKAYRHIWLAALLKLIRPSEDRHTCR